VYGLDLKETKERSGFKRFHSVDITHPFELEDKFDFVFHLAAHNVTHVGNQATDLYQLVNVRGTQNVINAASTKNFIFLSTIKVYRPEGKPITENSPIDPAGKYEKSKWSAEDVCRQIYVEGKLCVFRSVNIVGSEQSPKAVIPVLFQKAMAGEPLEIFGPSESVLQLLFVEDAVDAFVQVVENEGLAGNYNLASADHISLGELAKSIKNICRSKSEVRLTNQTPALFSEVISTKVEKALGWKARTTIKEILEDYHQAICQK
jgi:nucleoside-diphosphate-sugar epimerase